MLLGLTPLSIASDGLDTYVLLTHLSVTKRLWRGAGGEVSPYSIVKLHTGCPSHKNEYQRVIVTYVKEAKGTRLFASTVAAPLFEKIAERMLIHEGVLASHL